MTSFGPRKNMILLFFVFGNFYVSFVNTKEMDNSIDVGESLDFPWDFSLLGDHLQSPVDVITMMADKQNLKPLRFTAVNDKSITCTIQNSGHGVAISLDGMSDAVKPHLSGSFLEDTYTFENLHFHWGKDDYFGSEHFIDGESFSFEGHMVMYKKEYGSIKNALMLKDGVVVLTFFAQVGEKNNYLDRLLQYIPQITDHHKNPKGIKAPSADPLLWFLPDVVSANRYTDYYAYPGSLTTSPFTESVTFILLPKPISISHKQLEVLRQLKNHESKNTKTNRRELQPLRGRPLIRANHIQWHIKTKKMKQKFHSSGKPIVSNHNNELD